MALTGCFFGYLLVGTLSRFCHRMNKVPVFKDEIMKRCLPCLRVGIYNLVFAKEVNQLFQTPLVLKVIFRNVFRHAFEFGTVS